MKKILTSFFLIVLVLALAVACKPALPVFTAGQEIGANADAQTTLKTGIATQTLAETNADLTNPTGTPGMSIDTSLISSATLYALAGQTITISSGDSLIDSGTLATGVTIYNLSTTAAGDGAVAHSTQVTFTSQVIPDGAGSKAILTFSLAGTDVSSRIEIFINATVLTANGGTARPNLDGDAVMGEANQDDFYAYPAVIGAPVGYAGNFKDPRDGISIVGGSALAVGATTGYIDFMDTRGGYTRMDLASLSGGIAVQKMDPATGNFAALALTNLAYDNTTGRLSFTLPAAVAVGDVYRSVFTCATIAENAATDGFIHGLNSGSSYWYWNGARESDKAKKQVVTISAVNGPLSPLAATTALAPRADATANLAAGFTFTTAKTFTISRNGAAAVTVTLNGAYATLGALNAAISGTVGWPAQLAVTAIDRTGDGTNDAFKIQSSVTGIGEYFIIAAGATSALGDLGLTAGTYVGRDESGTPIPATSARVTSYENFSGTTLVYASDDLLSIRVDGGGIQNSTVPYSAYWSLSDIVDFLNNDFTGVVASTDGQYITLTGTSTGSSSSIQITSTDFGWTIGTYYGTDIHYGDMDSPGISAFLSNGAYYLELNFARSWSNAPVKQSTVVPAGLIVNDSNYASVAWLTTDLIWLSDTLCRIKMPAGFAPAGSYRIKILPTVTTTDPVPYGEYHGVDGYYYLSPAFSF